MKEKNATRYRIFNGHRDRWLYIPFIFLSSPAPHVLKSHAPHIRRVISSVVASAEEHSPMVEDAIFFGSLLTQVVTVGLYELAFEI